MISLEAGLCKNWKRKKVLIKNLGVLKLRGSINLEKVSGQFSAFVLLAQFSLKWKAIQMRRTTAKTIFRPISILFYRARLAILH